MNNRIEFGRKILNLLPDSDISWLITKSRNVELSQRAPGKYELLHSTIFILSNIDPYTIASRFIPYTEIFGYGLIPGYYEAHHVGRWVDDVVDGDKTLPEGFTTIPEWIEYMKVVARSRGRHISKGFTPEFLLKYAINKISSRERPGDDLPGLFIRFFDGMLFEYHKRQTGNLFSELELQQLYSDTFGAPNSIFLIAAGSNARDGHIPEMAQLFGQVYALVGLEEDLSRGIYFIPAEVIEDSGLSIIDLRNNPQIVKNNIYIRRWIDLVMAESIKNIETLRQKQKNLDLKAQLFVMFQTWSINKDLEKLSRN